MRGEGDKARRALCVGLCLALVALLGLPFALRPPATASEGKKLVIISPHWEGIRAEFDRAFSEWTQAELGHATNIEWLDVGGTSDALRYVRSEFARSPDGIGIDLFFGGGVSPFLELMKDDLLQPCNVSEQILEAIPQMHAGMEIYDAGHLWFGACMAGFGILYNKEILDYIEMPPPETWADMGRPGYLTWVGSGDPRYSGSIHMVYEIILQAYGWEKGWEVVLRMSGNIRGFSRAASQVPKDCALGEIACGMAIDVYARRQIIAAGNDRMGFHMPEGLTAVNPDGIGMLKGAPNRELAEALVEFTLSESGQKLWLLKKGTEGGPKVFELGRMSVIPGFAARFGDQATISLDPFESISTFTFDSRKAGSRWGIMNDLIGACIIDTHNELVAAWEVVKDLPEDDPRVARFVAPPLSEEELMTTVMDKWADWKYRSATRARWVREAHERHRRIARGE